MEGTFVSVINCETGKDEFIFEQPELLGFASDTADNLFFTDPTYLAGPITFYPPTGDLVLTNWSRKHGVHGAILTADYSGVSQRFPLDAYVTDLSFSLDGNRVAARASKNAVCIHDIKAKKDILLRGQRIHDTSTRLTSVTGPPSMTSIDHDGKDTLIYS